MKRPDGAHPFYWGSFKALSPADWKVARFEEAAETEKGKLPKTVFEQPTENSVPYLLIEGFQDGTVSHTEDADLPMVEPSDTVVVADGSRSGLALRGVSGALGSTLLRYRARPSYDGDFVFYVLQSLHEWLNSATIGGAVPHLDKRLLARLRLAMPDEGEQRAIVQVLAGVDDATATARQVLAKARRLKTALLQTLFTQGIPGQHTQFKETKAGRIPEPWDAPQLGRLVDIDAGVTLNQDRAPTDNAFQYLTVINVQRAFIVIDEPRYIQLSASEVPRKLLQEDDIVIVEGHANSAEIGRAAMIEKEHAGMSFQNHLFRVRVTDPEVEPKFLLQALNSEHARRHWNATCSTSSGLNTINRRQLRRMPIFKPSHGEQKDILQVLEAAQKRIDAAQGEVAALEKLKRALMQSLLTGQVRLPPISESNSENA